MLRSLITDLVLPLALGGAATLSFAPFGWYGITLLALAGLLGLWRHAGGPIGAAWRGGLFGCAWYMAGTYWHGTPTQVSGLFPPMLILQAAEMACLIAFVGGFAGFTRGLPRVIWALLLVPAGWLLAELLRAYFGMGQPWLSMGYALTDAPLTPIIPLVGVHGLGFALLAAAGGLLLLVVGGLIDRLAVIIAASAIPLLLWWLPPAVSWTEPAGAPVEIAVLQAGLAQAPTDQALLKVADVDIGLIRAPGITTAGLLPQAGLLADFGPAMPSAKAPDQRLNLLRMRALETGRPLLRVAANDIRAVIEADGQVRMHTGKLTTGQTEATVQPRSGATPYLRHGNQALWFGAVAVTVAGVLAGAVRRRA